MNLLRPPLVLQAHAGGRELGGPGRRWWPPRGPRSRTPSYCSASQPGAASNSDPPMIYSRTRMTQTPGVPLLLGVGPPGRTSCQCQNQRSRVGPANPPCSLCCSSRPEGAWTRMLWPLALLPLFPMAGLENKSLQMVCTGFVWILRRIVTWRTCG